MFKYENLDHKNPRFLNVQQNIQLFWYSLLLKYKNLDFSESNHLWSELESQCPKIRSLHFYPKAKYGFCTPFWSSYLTTGEYRKVGFIKVGEKTFAISETSAFSTWPKWRFVLKRKFCLTQKEILKTSKLKPKMVILVLRMVMVPKGLYLWQKTSRKKTESCSAPSSRNFLYRCIVIVWIRGIV